MNRLVALVANQADVATALLEKLRPRPAFAVDDEALSARNYITDLQRSFAEHQQVGVAALGDAPLRFQVENSRCVRGNERQRQLERQPVLDDQLAELAIEDIRTGRVGVR